MKLAERDCDLLEQIGDNAPVWLCVDRPDLSGQTLRGGNAGRFSGTTFHWTDIVIVAAWGVAGLLAAIRYFSWDPRSG